MLCLQTDLGVKAPSLRVRRKFGVKLNDFITCATLKCREAHDGLATSSA